MSSKIPRRIVQIWGGRRELSLLSKAASANVRLLNPEYEYLSFDDNRMESFVDEHFPEYRAVYHSFRYPIQRFDFFKYLAIYKFGGFYFDLDVFFARSLNDLLEFSCVFPFDELTTYSYLRNICGMDWEIGNYAFGAVAGHPFLKEVINNCVKAQREPEWVQPMVRPIPKIFREKFRVLCSTGPGLISRTLAEYPDAAIHVKVLFPENVVDQSKWHQFGSYGIDLRKRTWGKRKNVVIRLLNRRWENRVVKEAIRIGNKNGPMRTLKFEIGRTDIVIPRRPVQR